MEIHRGWVINISIISININIILINNIQVIMEIIVGESPIPLES